jgi:hypothetical protein
MAAKGNSEALPGCMLGWKDMTWSTVRTAGDDFPGTMFHCAAVTSDRKLCVVGGGDGRKPRNDVYCLETRGEFR